MTVSLGVTLFQIAFWIYLAATVCYIAYLFNKSDKLGKIGTGLLVLGLFVHAGSLVVRTSAAHRPPFLNLYEYMLSLTWGAVVVYLVLERITKNRILGAFVVPLIAAIAFMAILLPTEVNPTMPALKSAWRVPHIATAILAYAAFGIASALAAMYLIGERSQPQEGGKKNNKESFWASRLPALATLDQISYRTIAFGFLMQTLLIITGAIWAEKAWGNYWSWDPKETWALITWLIYAAYLHMRTNKGWKGHKSAITSVAGFAAVIFTLFGVNWLGGMHSYGRIGQ